MSDMEGQVPSEEGAVGTRVKTLTEKGTQFTVEITLKKFKSSVTAWNKACKLFKEVFETSPLEELSRSGENVTSLFNEVKANFNSLVQLSGTELDSSVETRFREVETENRTLIDNLNVRLNSRLEKKSTRSISQRSRLSQKSITMKAGEAANLAEAQTKLKFLELETSKQAQLEEQQRQLQRLQREFEEIKAQREYEIAQSRLQVVNEVIKEELEDDFDQDSDQVSGKTELLENYIDSQYKNVCESKVENTLYKTALSNPLGLHQNVDAAVPKGTGLVGSNIGVNVPPVVIPKQTFHSQPPLSQPTVGFNTVGQFDYQGSQQTFNQPQTVTPNMTNPQVPVVDFARNVCDQISLSRLPMPVPSIFSGDPLKYPAWKASFDTLINNRGIPTNERLHYLSSYLSGDAKECVEGYFLLSSGDAYQEALAVLESRFGNSFVLSNAFRDKLEAWPRINARDSASLRKFVDFLRQCDVASHSIPSLKKALDDERGNSQILSKLPEWIIPRWGHQVQKHKRNPKNRDKKDSFPSFHKFVEFLIDESDVANDPVTSLSAVKGLQIGSKSKVQGVRTFTTEVKEQCSDVCVFCGQNHHLKDCVSFLDESIENKQSFVKRNGLCWSCLCRGHKSKDCPNKSTCTQCGRRHHLAFHDWHQQMYIQRQSQQSKHTPSQAVCSGISHMNDTEFSNKSSMIVPVWLSHEDNPNCEVLVYCMLDSQSDTSFILEDACKELGVKGPSVDLSLSTMTTTNQLIKCNKVNGLSVRGFKSNKKIALPCLYSQQKMPTNRSHIPRPEMVDSWPHLARIRHEIMPLMDCSIALLLGYNCAQAMVPREVIPPVDNGPFAQRTDLGWGIVGVIDHSNISEESFVSHRILSCEVPNDVNGNDKLIHVAYKTKTKEVLTPCQIGKILESDFKDIDCDEHKVSLEDKQFLNIMESNIHMTNGHYEMPLPFKSNAPRLTNNKEAAARRLQSLKSRFKGDSRYHANYVAFMDEMITNGYAEKLQEADDSLSNQHWYIPHFGVHSKPDKLRVVFDCSAQYRNVSLNDTLLQGPDLVNSLIGVLCRFRKDKVAFMCDIEKMFYQFRVKPEHRDFLRFLWWDNGDFNNHPSVYRMTVHIFGATSSPSCASFGLKQVAKDNEKEFGDDVGDFIRKDFYVDDGLKSLPSEDQAIDLIKRTKDLCNKGGLRLHKFVSNSKQVLESIAIEDRSKNVQNVDLKFDDLPIEKALGVEWCVESDAFQFRIVLKDRPLTRRGILSTIGSIYDPLGFVAPFTLLGKQILQSLCRENFDWDAKIPEDLETKWLQWRDDVLELQALSIDRCIKPKDFDKVSKVEFHHFSDASMDAYGQCSYLRLKDVSGRVHVAFLMGKARVAPLRSVSIPRLELTAAVVSVKVAALLQSEFKFENAQHIFWSDSKVVLGYVANDSKRFHVFVANRIQLIRNFSQPDQWRHVRGDINPADEASRGLRPRELLTSSKWISGPEFLWQDEVSLGLPKDISLSDSDPEVRSSKTSFAVKRVPKDDILDRLSRVSKWNKLVKVVALCLKWKEWLRSKTQGNNSKKESLYSSVSVVDILNAEREVVRLVQADSFPHEKKILADLQYRSDDSSRDQRHDRNHALKEGSPLYKLDCFLDSNDIIRVGGRIKHADLGYGEVHPVVLPKNSHFSHLLIQHFHELVKHQGRLLTQNRLRSSGYWIINGNSEVSRFISKCVVCRKSRRPTEVQKMSDLPQDRVQVSAPFTYCGTDYFGPFMIKEGRKELKRYGVIFTCMASRAVHIEVANSLSTDSFINALRRFISIRGPIRVLRSDQGTNFIGAKSELSQGLENLELSRIKQYSLKQGFDFEFKMNPPSSSHMGGVWERLIRSVRSILSVILAQHSTQLDDESLRTFMYEIAAILNSRPLCAQSINDSDAPEPLTPNHILTTKSSIILPPPGEFIKADVYLIKRWRRVQYLVNEFWYRWRNEYLKSLQFRSKWQKPKRNLSVGDIVILRDDNLTRNDWKLARVVEVYPSQDGYVRSVKLLISDSDLSKKGTRTKAVSYLVRPVHKVVLLVECE